MDIALESISENPDLVLQALDGEEGIILTYQGKSVAHIVPLEEKVMCKPSEHEAFGMWADREDMADPVAYIQELRRGRFEHMFKDE